MLQCRCNQSVQYHMVYFKGGRDVAWRDQGETIRRNGDGVAWRNGRSPSHIGWALSDVRVTRQLTFAPGITVAVDQGYLDYALYDR